MKRKMEPGKDYIGAGCGVFIVNDKSETLFLLRNNNCRNEAGKWNKVGGGIEFGEKVEDAIRRETLEEVGLELADIEFLSFTDHILPDENQHWIGFNYMAMVSSGEVENREPHKHDEVKWFKFDEIPDCLAMPTEEALPLMIKRYKEKYSK